MLIMHTSKETKPINAQWKIPSDLHKRVVLKGSEADVDEIIERHQEIDPEWKLGDETAASSTKLQNSTAQAHKELEGLVNKYKSTPDATDWVTVPLPALSES